jgi:hypothetical protein
MRIRVFGNRITLDQRESSYAIPERRPALALPESIPAKAIHAANENFNASNGVSSPTDYNAVPKKPASPALDSKPINSIADLNRRNREVFGGDRVA